MKTLVLIIVLFFGSVLDVSTQVKSFKEHLILACQEYKVNYKDMLRIAYVESKFKPNALNKNRNGTVDVGMFQINSVHHSICYDAGYDVYTTEGNVYCAVFLVSKLKRYKSIDKHWLGRYHSKTKAKKLAYITKLEKVKL